jgi:predicted HTH domain antitoxin
MQYIVAQIQMTLKMAKEELQAKLRRLWEVLEKIQVQLHLKSQHGGLP